MDSQTLKEPLQETKDALLRFLLDEKSKHEKSKWILIQVFKGNLDISEGSLKKLLEKLNFNISEINRHIITISQAKLTDELEENSQLELLNLDPQEAIDNMKKIAKLNIYNDIKEFCNSGDAEKILEGFIEYKFELFFNEKIASTENRLEDLNKSMIELQNNSNQGKKTFTSFRYFVLSIIVILFSFIYYRIYEYNDNQALVIFKLFQFEEMLQDFERNLKQQRIKSESMINDNELICSEKLEYILDQQWELEEFIKRSFSEKTNDEENKAPKEKSSWYNSFYSKVKDYFRKKEKVEGAEIILKQK